MFQIAPARVFLISIKSQVAIVASACHKNSFSNVSVGLQNFVPMPIGEKKRQPINCASVRIKKKQKHTASISGHKQLYKNMLVLVMSGCEKIHG